MEKILPSRQTRDAISSMFANRDWVWPFEVAHLTYLDTYTSITSRGVIWMVVQPNQVANPIGVGVTRDHDVVVDLVIIESLERAVAVGLITIPCVVIQWVDVSVRNGLIDTREDGLGPNDTPCSCPLLRGDELAVKPVLLPAAHHGTTCVV